MELFNIIFEVIVNRNYKIILYKNDQKEISNIKLNEVNFKLKMMLTFLLNIFNLELIIKI